MYNGEITEVSPPEEMFSNPKHEKTQQFLKSIING